MGYGLDYNGKYRDLEDIYELSNTMSYYATSDQQIGMLFADAIELAFNDIENYDLVITLCNNAKDRCPIFDSENQYVHWDIEDPAKFKGSLKDTYICYSRIRDIIYYISFIGFLLYLNILIAFHVHLHLCGK